jgi:hypothetical protein
MTQIKVKEIKWFSDVYPSITLGIVRGCDCRMAENKKATFSGGLLNLVAGAGFEPTTFGL